MANYREILRLSSDPKNTQRSIARAVHSSRDTIRDVLAAAEKAGVTEPAMSRYVNGTRTPRLTTYAAMTQALGIGIDDLLVERRRK